jgi:hypothetical protein
MHEKIPQMHKLMRLWYFFVHFFCRDGGTSPKCRAVDGAKKEEAAPILTQPLGYF